MAVLAVVARVLFLTRWPANFDADEALIALHAGRLLDGPISVFLPGQAYMGTLQSALAGLFMRIFGDSATVARLAPLVWFVPGWLALERLDRLGTQPLSYGRGRWLLAFQWFLPPSVLLFLSMKLRGGFVESIVLALFALILLWPREVEPRRPTRLVRWALGGILLGLAIWTHDQILMLLPGVLVLAWIRSPFRIGPPLVSLAALVVGLAVGYVPLWLPRLAPHILDLPGVGTAFQDVTLQQPFEPRSLRIVGLAFHQALVAGGSERGWTAAAAWLHTGLTAIAVLFAAQLFIRRPARIFRQRPLLVVSLYLAAALLGALILIPAYTEDPNWYRYTLLLAPLIVYSRALVTVRLPRGFDLAGVLLFALLSAQVYTGAVPGWAYRTDALRPALAEYLESRSIRYVLADWMLAAPIQFFSGGRILAQEQSRERLTESTMRVLFAQETWIVTPNHSTRDLSSAETAFDIRWRPPRMDPALTEAVATLDFDATLLPHLEPWPLLPAGSWQRDWRGWPYQRPLERFDTIFWLPNRLSDKGQRAAVQRRIADLLASREFELAVQVGEKQILHRLPASD